MEKPTEPPTAPELMNLLPQHWSQLLQVVRSRLDPRLASRVDCEDILQEAYFELSRRFPEFVRDPSVSFFVWARRITSQVLLDIQRRHLGATKRDVRRQIAMSSTVQSMIYDPIETPSAEVQQIESLELIRKTLQQMSQLDRQVLTLRHFDGKTNKEVAEALGLQTSAASRRYLRAVERLKEYLDASRGDESFPHSPLSAFRDGKYESDQSVPESPAPSLPLGSRQPDHGRAC